MKRLVGKRYKPPNTNHTEEWEHLDEYKIGRRLLTPGQVVEIRDKPPGRQRATVTRYEFLYAERHRETGEVMLTMLGGRKGRILTRTFTPEKVGKLLWMHK